MKKKIISLVLAVIMIISIMPMCFAEETMALEEKVTTAGLGNFKKTNIYSAGMFQDFLSSDWFASNVINAYELGLVKGTTATNFNPKGNITVAETIVLACRLHSIYNTGKAEFTQGSPWYQVYVDYALANKIIPGTYSDYNAKISRANFAFILNNSLPEEALKGINNIINGTLKDVANDNRAEAIYNLYRAGILTGNDKYGTFNPNSNIQRSEVATIVTRMADRTQRKMFKLEEKPVVPESVTLAGKTSINVGESTQWKATIAPSSANQWVSWTSGNPGVATVDANGNIKAVKAGQSNITATAANGVKKTVLITVKKPAPKAENVAGKLVTLSRKQETFYRIGDFSHVDDIKYEAFKNDNGTIRVHVNFSGYGSALDKAPFSSSCVYFYAVLYNEYGMDIAKKICILSVDQQHATGSTYFDVSPGRYYIDFVEYDL